MELQQYVYTTILDKDKYLICSLRVTERVKCCHSILSSKKYTKVKKVICIILIHFVIYVCIYVICVCVHFTYIDLGETSTVSASDIS